jgi:hypothetical protein
MIKGINIITYYIMLSDLFIAPSLNSLFITGFLLLLILVIFIFNYKQFLRLDYFNQLSLLSLFVIAIGIHGLVHLGTEAVYGFNPYKWF